MAFFFFFFKTFFYTLFVFFSVLPCLRNSGGEGKHNNPLLFVQAHRSQISCGTKTRHPSVRSRSLGTGCWSGAACKSTVSCRTTQACSSASPAIWQERSRQTPTWLLQVGPLGASSKQSAHLLPNSAPLPSLLFDSQILFLIGFSPPLSCLPRPSIYISLPIDRFVTSAARAIIGYFRIGA